MLLTKNIKITVSSSSAISQLRKIGIESKMGDEKIIKIEELSNNSHRIIEAKCDCCGIVKNLKYQTYNRNTNNNTEKYYCNKKECINEKRKIQINKKYGVDNIFQINEIKEKIKNTNLEKYGVEHPLKSPSIKEKMKKTNMNKYGVENIFQSDFIKEKIKNTNLKKYGVEYPQQSSIIRDKYSSLHTSSNEEKELSNFIKENTNENVLTSVKNVISGYELDIYLPNIKMAFEFNGLYWHNELNKDKKYHLNKTNLCEERGIRLIHIYEDQWEFKKDIVKSIILNKLKKINNKIFARNCKIMEVSNNKLIKEFLDKNHIQGFVPSKIKIGAFYNNELVSIMTFGNKRILMGEKKTKTGEYEMFRFCSKLNTNVIGVASRLFKYFIIKYNPDNIITYADRSFSNGNLYEKLGFILNSKTDPNYFYIVNRKREYRFKYRKSALIEAGFDSKKTEHEIMLERKIYRIYDSGHLKYIYSKS